MERDCSKCTSWFEVQASGTEEVCRFGQAHFFLKIGTILFAFASTYRGQIHPIVLEPVFSQASRELKLISASSIGRSIAVFNLGSALPQNTLGVAYCTDDWTCPVV